VAGGLAEALRAQGFDVAWNLAAGGLSANGRESMHRAVWRSDVVLLCVSTHWEDAAAPAPLELVWSVDAALERADDGTLRILVLLDACQPLAAYRKYERVELFGGDGEASVLEALQKAETDLRFDRAAGTGPATGTAFTGAIQTDTMPALYRLRSDLKVERDQAVAELAAAAASDDAVRQLIIDRIADRSPLVRYRAIQVLQPFAESDERIVRALWRLPLAYGDEGIVMGAAKDVLRDIGVIRGGG
jgi:hypothetical protein